MACQHTTLLVSKKTNQIPLHHSTEVSKCCSSNDRALPNFILHVGCERQSQNSLWQRQEHSQVFWDWLAGFVCEVLYWRQTSCTRFCIDCGVQQVLHSLACLKHCFSHFNSEMPLRSLQAFYKGAFKMWIESLETRGLWTQELTSALGKNTGQLQSGKGYASPVWQPVGWFQLMPHPPWFSKAGTIWTAEMPWLHGSQLLLPSIIWARTEGLSPCVRDWQDWAHRDQEKKKHCLHGCSAVRWRGKDLEEAEIHETFGAFQAEVLLFHQLVSELLHKCAFNF